MATSRAGRAQKPEPGPQDELEALVAQVRACTACGVSPRPLPHEPRPVVVASTTARILIAGQAPGTRVHETGVPFNDRSGDRLREWLGVSRDVFYDPTRFAIVPMGFCFPGQDERGGDLPPRRECAPLWRRRLIDAMPQIELVLAIGQHAQKWHMGKARGGDLTQTVQDWRVVVSQTTHPRVVPLPHPSWRNTGWLKRNPWFASELLPWLRFEVGELIAE